jgi:hypothetical protein
MQGISEAFAANVAATGFDPNDHVDRTAYLLEQLAAEVRRFGIIDGTLSREREADEGGPTGVQKVSLNLRIDRSAQTT